MTRHECEALCCLLETCELLREKLAVAVLSRRGTPPEVVQRQALEEAPELEACLYAEIEVCDQLGIAKNITDELLRSRLPRIVRDKIGRGQALHLTT